MLSSILARTEPTFFWIDWLCIQVVSSGSSTTDGVELLIEKEAENFYGLIGATYLTMYDDFDNISRNAITITNIL